MSTKLYKNRMYLACSDLLIWFFSFVSNGSLSMFQKKKKKKNRDFFSTAIGFYLKNRLHFSGQYLLRYYIFKKKLQNLLMELSETDF